MILLDENRTLAIWYAPINKDLDFLGCLQRPEHPTTRPDGSPRPPGEYDFDYRFRYYRDDNVFHSQDEKHWYHTEIPAIPMEEALAKLRGLLVVLTRMNGDNHIVPKIEEIVNTGDWQKFMNVFLSKPWAHAQEVDKGATA